MSDVEQFEDVAQDKADAAAELEYYDNTVRSRDDVIMALKDALDDEKTGDYLYALYRKVELKECISSDPFINLLGSLIIDKIALQIKQDAIRFVEQNGSEQ